MRELRTINQVEMRQINRAAIIDVIRQDSPVSRSDLAKRLNLSLPTVMRIFDELVEEKLVRPLSGTEWSGGRRRTLWELNSEDNLIVGVDLGGTKMYGALAEIGGSILFDLEFPNHNSTGEHGYEKLVTLIERLLAFEDAKRRRILGIGIGAPGITMHQEGVVTWAPSLNWKDYPLGAKLTRHFDLPVIVDNDVNLAVLGELWYGAGQNYQNVVLIAVGTGIGAGIIIDGALYRGAHEASGEIGYLLPGREFLGTTLTEFGILESLASGLGIANRATQALRNADPAQSIAGVAAENVFRASRENQDWAVRLIDETIDYLALAIANVSALFDPDIIILSGGVFRSESWLVGPIAERIEHALPMPPNLVVSQLGSKAAVLGAIVKVLYDTDDFYVVRKLS